MELACSVGSESGGRTGGDDANSTGPSAAGTPAVASRAEVTNPCGNDVEVAATQAERVPRSVLETALDTLVDRHEGFADHFRRLGVDWTPESPWVTGEFLYPLFSGGGSPDIDSFVEHIYGALVPFCLPRGEVRRVLSRARADGDYRSIIRLGDRARDLFVRTRGAQTNGGEAGELMLFLMLEQILRAPLLVSKMNLKTNSNMNVHGRDGIHVRWDKTLDTLVLHLGESKLHEDFASGIDDAIDSILEYQTELRLRRREIALINGHMDLTGLPPAAESQLRDMLHPYSGRPVSLPTVHTCLIGFEYPAYSAVAHVSPAEIEEAFRKQYTKRADKIREQVCRKVGDRLPPPARLSIFVFPFPDLQAFRLTFAQRLGMSI